MIRVLSKNFDRSSPDETAYVDVEATGEEMERLEQSLSGSGPVHFELDGLEADWYVKWATIGPLGRRYALQSNGPVKGFPS